MNPRIPENIIVSLIGIAGAGKSTLAPLLAQALGWRHMDTDRLLEAHYGRSLQEVYDTLGRGAFLAHEEQQISRLAACRLVVSTGGSVVYSQAAMGRLRLLGPVIWLRIGLESFKARVGPAVGRGLVRPQGQSLDELYGQRQPLYDTFADLAVDTDTHTPQECTRIMARWLAEEWTPQLQGRGGCGA